MFDPPRRLSIRSGATIPGYSIRRLGRPVVEATFKRDSIAAFDERVFITQHPVAVMPYGDFLHVVNGVFEGLYIPRNLVVANVLTESRSNAV